MTNDNVAESSSLLLRELTDEELGKATEDFLENLFEEVLGEIATLNHEIEQRSRGIIPKDGKSEQLGEKVAALHRYKERVLTALKKKSEKAQKAA